MKIQGKQVLVTGGTGGIGLALARELSRRGALVMLCGRNAPSLERALATVPHARGLVADLTQQSGRQQLRDAVDAQGGLDVLVSSAGTEFQREFAKQDAANLERDLYERAARACFTARDHGGGLVTCSFVNLMGTVLSAYALLPALSGRSGTLVHVRTRLACSPADDACVCAASRSALDAWYRSLRRSAARDRVRVVEVPPPSEALEMGASSGEETGAAEAVARAIAEGVAKDRTQLAFGAARFLSWLAYRRASASS
jgi:uncharacterized oxidoreductase